MADTVSEQQRSYMMSRIRGSDTRPEQWVRSALHRAGFRFTLRAPNNKKLPGKPDLVLPAHLTVLFVHGCFWHGHEDCLDFRLPKSRVEWWRKKIEGNRARDQRNLLALQALGWRVLVVWTCALRGKQAQADIGERLALILRASERNNLSLLNPDRKGFRTQPLFPNKRRRRAVPRIPKP